MFPLEDSPQTGWCPVHTRQEWGNEGFKSQAELSTLTFLVWLKRCLEVFLSSWLVLFFMSLCLPCVNKGVHALTCQAKNIRDPIVISKDIGQTWEWRHGSYLPSLTHCALAEHKNRFPNCVSKAIFSVWFKHLCLWISERCCPQCDISTQAQSPAGQDGATHQSMALFTDSKRKANGKLRPYARSLGN